ncbi:hypothetical protein HDU80_007264 [Chytriomyces hyalinus]|nr:hypothetical protein HDU80_007264 [Chytriomyces hyalinus]
MFSDLECDYINPIDLCSKLNQFVIPENVGHALLAVVFLLNGAWISLLLNLPLLGINVNKIMNNRHTYDATEIFRTLPQHKKECFFKLAFYLLSFFFSANINSLHGGLSTKTFPITLYLYGICESWFLSLNDDQIFLEKLSAGTGYLTIQDLEF